MKSFGRCPPMSLFCLCALLVISKLPQQVLSRFNLAETRSEGTSLEDLSSLENSPSSTGSSYVTLMPPSSMSHAGTARASEFPKYPDVYNPRIFQRFEPSKLITKDFLSLVGKKNPARESEVPPYSIVDWSESHYPQSNVDPRPSTPPVTKQLAIWENLNSVDEEQPMEDPKLIQKSRAWSSFPSESRGGNLEGNRLDDPNPTKREYIPNSVDEAHPMKVPRLIQNSRGSSSFTSESRHGDFQGNGLHDTIPKESKYGMFQNPGPSWKPGKSFHGDD